jgi:uncharacterized membrane protein HdeD (DUF308 family)
MSDPEPRGYMRRQPGLMVALGIILLLPGICAIVFMASMGSDADSGIVFLWFVCVAIAAGGVFLLVRAFR